MAINIKRAVIEFLLRIGAQKPVLFLRSYFNEGLYCGVNNVYSINEILIKNDIDTITIDFNVENEIYYSVLALLNSNPTKRCKLEVLLIPK